MLTKTLHSNLLQSSSSNMSLSPSAVFPAKLHRLLEEAEENGYDDVISWLPDGKSFQVYDTQRFAAEIMPTYFCSNKYRSFQKNLNMWFFKSERGGGKQGASSHPLFRRGMPHLIEQMKRQPLSDRILKQQQRRAAAEEAAAYYKDMVLKISPSSSSFSSSRCTTKTTPSKKNFHEIDVEERNASLLPKQLQESKESSPFTTIALLSRINHDTTTSSTLLSSSSSSSVASNTTADRASPAGRWEDQPVSDTYSSSSDSRSILTTLGGGGSPSAVSATAFPPLFPHLTSSKNTSNFNIASTTAAGANLLYDDISWSYPLFGAPIASEDFRTSHNNKTVVALQRLLAEQEEAQRRTTTIQQMQQEAHPLRFSMPSISTTLGLYSPAASTPAIGAATGNHGPTMFNTLSSYPGASLVNTAATTTGNTMPNVPLRNSAAPTF